MFKDNIDNEQWNQILDREIWLRLAKISQAGVMLGEIAKTRLGTLSDQYPQWKIAEDGRDEFPFWMGDGDESRKFVKTPRPYSELVDWLKKNPTSNHWEEEDDWKKCCRDDFEATSHALSELSTGDIWPIDRWRQALQAWSEENLIKCSWPSVGTVLSKVPYDVLQPLVNGVSWWLKAISKSFNGNDELFLELCRRVLTLEYTESDDSENPVSRAINHPVGYVTEALLNWCFQQSPEDGQGLPAELSIIFTDICNSNDGKYRHGRVLLSIHIIALFRLDREWAIQYLLPSFDWRQSEVEARIAWEGFLWSPRLYRPLMELIKKPFLDTAVHYEKIGAFGQQYATLLTFAALDRYI
ncbi:MAG: hypothetical protein WC799_08285 [Desulfobacteraceae bacterium]|jgi:hypothetical protein